MRYRITIIPQWTPKTPSSIDWVAKHWHTSYFTDKRVRIHGQQSGYVLSLEQ